MNVNQPSADLTAIFDIVDLPIVIVKVDCTVSHFNRAAASVLHLLPADIGKHLGQIQFLVDRPNIVERCVRVIADRAPCRYEIKDDERCFLLRIAVYPGGTCPIMGAVLMFTNLTAQRACIEQAIYEREFTKNILNTIMDPLIVLDAELRVQAGNRAFFTMFKVSREEAKDSLLTELKHHTWDVPELWNYLKDTPSYTNQPAFEFDHDFPRLGRRTVLVHVRQLLFDGHAKPMTLLTLTDITERRQSEEALRRLNNELESRVQARTEELMELQERLRALATGLNLAEQRQRQRLAADLHDYLGQLLALSLIKLGQARQKPMEATLGKLFGEVIESTEKALTYTRTLVSQLCPPVLQEFGLPVALQWLGEQMHQQNLRVSVELKTEIPPVPEDQALLLFQSVRELLLNCVKHGRTHEAMIAVEQSEGSLRITVSDHGCGFDASVGTVNKINADFPAFGLFSVRERMLSFGGRLAIESALGKGTVATLIVPLSQASVEPSTVADQSTNVKEVSESSRIMGQLAKTVGKMGNGDLSHQPALSAIGSKIRVLIADDHAMIRQGLRSVLDQYSEIQVVGEAANGEEAVLLANQLHPDVILMDVTMPKMDGIEATKLIKRSWPDMVVIGLSVHTAGQVGRAMTDAGAAAFINKEAAVNELYEAIHAVGRSTGLWHHGATT